MSGMLAKLKAKNAPAQEKVTSDPIPKTERRTTKKEDKGDQKITIIFNADSSHGALLATFLLKKKHKVHVIQGRSSLCNYLSNIQNEDFFIHLVSDRMKIHSMISALMPHSIYYFWEEIPNASYTELHESSAHLLQVLGSIETSVPDTSFLYIAPLKDMYPPQLTPINEDTRIGVTSFTAINRETEKHYVTCYREAHGLNAGTLLYFDTLDSTLDHDSRNPIRQAIAQLDFILRNKIAEKVLPEITPLHIDFNIADVFDITHVFDFVTAMYHTNDELSSPNDYILSAKNYTSFQRIVTDLYAECNLSLKWEDDKLLLVSDTNPDGILLMNLIYVPYRVTYKGDNKRLLASGWKDTIKYRPMIEEISQQLLLRSEFMN